MLKEIVLVAIGAAFGLGTALAAMAAPLLFPNAPSWVWHWMFWSGIALMVLMVADGAFLLIFGRALHFGPSALANFALAALAIAVIWQTMPERNGIGRETRPAALQPVGPPPSFRQVFDKDFPNYGGFGLNLPLKDTNTGADYSLPARLLLDFNAGTKFLAVFISRGERAFIYAISIADNIDGIINYFNTVQMDLRRPGDTTPMKSASLAFSRMVYLYMEEDLPLASQAQIERHFQQKSLTVSLRGHAYYALCLSGLRANRK